MYSTVMITIIVKVERRNRAADVLTGRCQHIAVELSSHYATTSSRHVHRICNDDTERIGWTGVGHDKLEEPVRALLDLYPSSTRLPSSSNL